MINRKNRFHGYNSLRSTYSRGQTVRSGPLSLKFVLNTKRDSSRIAVVISKKVHKSAVGRNRIRRRIFEIVRLKIPEFSSNADMIITIFDDSVAEMPAIDLKQMIEQLLKNAKLV
ncbi:MAG TPA: ribonuclease P protein component [Candidatus Saccharibacteria bacterium]|nr:ribonuclease P protein component [Candidatus Saccharibacteria bacterium]